MWSSKRFLALSSQEYLGGGWGVGKSEEGWGRGGGGKDILCPRVASPFQYIRVE